MINFYQFNVGIQEDILKRDKFLKEKGIKIDSMGKIEYEDVRNIIDSLDNCNFLKEKVIRIDSNGRIEY